MPPRSLSAAILFAVALLDSAWADDIDRAIQGIGADSCATFSRRFSQAPGTWEPLYFNWAQGYLSGMNAVLHAEEKARVDLLDKQPLQKYLLREFCRQNPRMQYYNAVIKLYTALPDIKDK